MRRTADDCWVHSTCAFWHPELKFLDQNVVNAARSAVHVSDKRRALMCRVCNTRNGACIQCADAACRQSFHVQVCLCDEVATMLAGW